MQEYFGRATSAGFWFLPENTTCIFLNKELEINVAVVYTPPGVVLVVQTHTHSVMSPMSLCSDLMPIQAVGC